MNKKLQHQLMSITDIDKNQQQTKRMQWLYAYNERQQVLAKLRKAYPSKDVLAAMDKKGRKEIAKTYSDAVVKFDSQYVNRGVFV
jgi:mannitol/fructose-specific phosphotransferase system IIA component (Ntr-type)